jgi:hypothetical protein
MATPPDYQHTLAVFHADLSALRHVLRQRRSQRVVPGIDDWQVLLTRLLTDWPALLLSLTDEEVAAWYAYAEHLLASGGEE